MWLEILQVAAAALSPLVAVQVTVWRDNRKEVRARRLDIFHTLMMTRDSWLSPEHVRALNAIPIEFHGDRKAKAILEAWRAYLAHLNLPLFDNDTQKFLWADQRAVLFVKMLHTMAVYFKYDFDETFIRTTAYTPRAHGQLEDESLEMRRLLLELLRGERSLPVSEAAAGQQAQLATPAKPQLVAPAPTTGDQVEDLKKQLAEPGEPTRPKPTQE